MIDVCACIQSYLFLCLVQNAKTIGVGFWRFALSVDRLRNEEDQMKSNAKTVPICTKIRRGSGQSFFEASSPRRSFLSKISRT